MKKNKSFNWNTDQPIICSAPMHGITNSAQRQIFKKFGADVVFSEMVSSMGIKYTNRKTQQKTCFKNKEKPVIIQIFGNTIEETITAAHYAESIWADGIDFNCGCPARSMIASGNGGKLLLEPDTLIHILSSIKKNIKIPLSLKTRIGFDQILPPSFYHNIAQKSGIDCLIIHGRTVKQMYRGRADWRHIKAISQKLSIPVIGSGDITDPYEAVERIKNFTPAGIMIGRGAIGQPWIFAQIKKIIAGHTIRPRLSRIKIKKTIRLHLKLLINEFLHNYYYTSRFAPDEIKIHALRHMRKHYGWYLKSFAGAKKIRLKLMTGEDLNEVNKLIENI